MTGARVADLLDTLQREMPSQWAEPWDRVGLLTGDAEAPLRRVFVSLDPTPEALAGAIDAGAGVLLTHHPAFLEAPAGLRAAAGMAGVPFAATRAGIALVAAHTNLDRSPAGASALPIALGLSAGEPLERSDQQVATITTYAPPGAVERLLGALADAGAGRVGSYDACSFVGGGEGRYTPLPDSTPVGKAASGAVVAPETRIEAVCARDRAAAVIDALRAAHPYEEPLIVVGEAGISRGAARLGRLCDAPPASTLERVAASVARALDVRPTVWGPRSRRIARIAIAPGSGGSLLPDARAAGADVIVTGELRYHEALDAVTMGLTVIEAGHDATEWPMVPFLAAAAARTPGIGSGNVVVDAARTHWWTSEGS